jgi:hypothetical protein
LKQIGVTIPQWGKIARKLIRLGVTRIQEDMTKKYAQISSGSNKRKPQEPEEGQERRRRVTLPSDTPAPFAGSPGFGSFTAPIMSRSSSFGGYMEAPFSTTTFSSNPSYSSTPSTPYTSAPSTPIYSAPSTPNTPSEAPFSPMLSPVTTSPTFRTPYENSPQVQAPFGASLYNMIHSAPPTATNIFATATPMRSPSLTSVPSPSQAPRSMDITQSPSGFTPNYAHFSNTASLPYSLDAQPGYIPQGHIPTYHTPLGVPHSPSMSSYHPMQMQYTTPPPPNLAYAPTYMISSPSSAPPSLASSPSFTSYSSLGSSPSSAYLNLPPQFQLKDDGTTHMF